jgi:hypothetical protein
MNRSILIMAAVLATAGTVNATAWADQKPTAQNVQGIHPTVMGHRVLSITEHSIQEMDGKHTRRLAGADIRIEAEPGMTAEYLTVELRRHLGAIRGDVAGSQSVFLVEGANVEVRSTGDGFVFHVTAPDSKNAQEIMRRARLLS